MKAFLRLTLATVLLLVTIPAIAGGNKDGCKLQGSWYGHDGDGIAWWKSTADGQSASHGTLNLEVPSSVQFFPGAVTVTELKGQWKKTSGNTYDWTVIGYPLDATANTLFIAKVSGRDIMGEDCDTLLVADIVMEVFLPTAKIDLDSPIMIETSFPDHPGYRVKVDLPELLP